LYGILADDFDSDGNIDLLLNTNDLGTEVNTGQYDALNGLHLKGNGKGGFAVVRYDESGYYIPSNGKALIKLIYKDRYAVASSQNKDSLRLFQLGRPNEFIRLGADDVAVDIFLRNGGVRREEAYFGNGFLSQSARFIAINSSVQRIKILNGKGITREIQF
jgi:hypothetical protein